MIFAAVGLQFEFSTFGIAFVMTRLLIRQILGKRRAKLTGEGFAEFF